MKLNQQAINKYRMTARRTLAIISRIEEGKTAEEIRREVPDADRNLINYYIKQLTKTK